MNTSWPVDALTLSLNQGDCRMVYGVGLPPVSVEPYSTGDLTDERVALLKAYAEYRVRQNESVCVHPLFLIRLAEEVERRRAAR